MPKPPAKQPAPPLVGASGKATFLLRVAAVLSGLEDQVRRLDPTFDWGQLIDTDEGHRPYFVSDLDGVRETLQAAANFARAGDEEQAAEIMEDVAAELRRVFTDLLVMGLETVEANGRKGAK
jgi:hypothetical protein